MSDFNRNSTVYIVRISSNLKTAQNDYNNFLNQIRQKQDSIWDNTKNNSIQVSDYFGFIVGNGGNEEVKIHKVIRVGLSSQRHVTWNANTPYNPNNGKSQNSPGHRTIIYLSGELATFSWRWWKQTVQYSPNCASWMPRGTMKSRNPLAAEFKSDDFPPLIPSVCVKNKFFTPPPPVPPPLSLVFNRPYEEIRRMTLEQNEVLPSSEGPSHLNNQINALKRLHYPTPNYYSNRGRWMGK